MLDAWLGNLAENTFRETVTLLRRAFAEFPSFDHCVAEQLAALGIPGFACTPARLPEPMADAIRGG